MNNKDRIFARNELIAWGHWQREGCTLQNALGFVVGSLDGNVNDVQISPIVPTRFNIDKNVDIVQKVVCKFPPSYQEVIAGVFRDRMKIRRIAIILGVSKWRVESRVYSGYEAVYSGLTGQEKNKEFYKSLKT